MATLPVIAKNAVNPNVLLWVKHTVVHPYDGLLFSNKQTTDISKQSDESQGNHAEWQKSIPKVLYHDSINIPSDKIKRWRTD